MLNLLQLQSKRLCYATNVRTSLAHRHATKVPHGEAVIRRWRTLMYLSDSVLVATALVSTAVCLRATTVALAAGGLTIGSAGQRCCH